MVVLCVFQLGITKQPMRLVTSSGMEIKLRIIVNKIGNCTYSPFITGVPSSGEEAIVIGLWEDGGEERKTP
jgi:hypothetical protein